MEKCKWVKFIDWWSICEKPIQQPEEKGSFWGWLKCAMSCSNYTHGFDYSYKTDKCLCKGKWVSPSMWRR